jgi:glucose-1-phosphate cytidylyltransferase
MILCGGEGSRLKEETEMRPKPMLEIGDRPMLWHIMQLYASHGLNRFVLCLGYKGHIIKDYFLNYRTFGADMTVDLGPGGKTRYHTQNGAEDWRVTLAETGQKALTGARVARAAAYVDTDLFCLTYGDGLGDIDITALLAFHRGHGKLATVTGVRPPGRFGELQIGPGGRASEFNEKLQTTGGLINGGFFVFQRSVIERYLTTDDDCTLEREPLQRLARDSQLMVYAHKGFWQPMDTFREWRLLNELWESGQAPWKLWDRPKPTRRTPRRRQPAKQAA